MTREDLTGLAACALVIGGVAIGSGWWQQSVAAGAAAFFGLWALAVMRPGGGA